MSKSDEIRSLAVRVKELRQELESVEARLRALSGDESPNPIEPLDSPTVLTTNHAQRKTGIERLVPWLAATAACALLLAGIGLGWVLRSPAESAMTTSPTGPASAATNTTSNTPASTANANATPTAAESAPPPTALATATATATPQATPTNPSPTVAPTPPGPTPVTPVATAPYPRSRSNPDRGF
jgi:hypothetical protein